MPTFSHGSVSNKKTYPGHELGSHEGTKESQDLVHEVGGVNERYLGYPTRVRFLKSQEHSVT